MSDAKKNGQTPPPSTRIFLVGCSRSGTTIVQRTLTETYRLYSLPETDFFGLAIGGGLGALGCRLGLARSPRVYQRALERLQRLLDLDPGIATEYRGRRLRPLIELFVATLDRKARDEHETGWLEKTPKHFRHTRFITRYVPDARIIHVVRRGPDVVASIRDRALRYPQEFARQQDPAYAIKLWNRAVRAALRDAEAGLASIVGYEAFARDPDAVVDRLGAALDLTRRSPSAHAPPAIIRGAEGWKGNVTGAIEPARSKFSELFDSAAQASILSQLDMRSYDSVARLALSASKNGQAAH